MPAPWRWHYGALRHLRERLCRGDTTAACATAPRLEFPGEAPTPSELDRLWTELRRETDPLFEVECALQRIHEGLYEFCAETGRPIPLERLRARPWTRYCSPVAPPSRRESPP